MLANASWLQETTSANGGPYRVRELTEYSQGGVSVPVTFRSEGTPKGAVRYYEVLYGTMRCLQSAVTDPVVSAAACAGPAGTARVLGGTVGVLCTVL